MESVDLKDLIENKDLSGIDTYLKNGGSVNVTNNRYGPNPIFSAIWYLGSRNGSVDKDRFRAEDKITLRLIEAGANVNSILKFHDSTPLLEALNRKRSKSIIMKLLNAGSDINAVNKMGYSPLLLAIKANYDKELICKLIEMGANVNHVGWGGSTVLSYVFKRPDNSEITKILINSGAIVEALNSRRLLMDLDCGLSCKEGKCKNEKAIDLLVSKGLNLNVRFADEKNRTLIHYVFCNYLTSSIIKSGVSVESKDVNGRTPLILMSGCMDDFHKVKTLLTLFNANPNTVDYKLKTPLHYAVKYNRIKTRICELLLFHGSKIFAKDVCNKTAFDLICDAIEGGIGENWFSVFLFFVKYFLLYIGESNFYNYFRKECRTVCEEWSKLPLVDCTVVCKKELSEMKRKFLKADLTFYKFCLLKRFYKSKPIDMYVDELNYNFDQIKEMFPLYHNFIIIRIKDNVIKNNRKHLLHSLDGIIIRPLPVENDNDSQVELYYDCKYLVARYLNHKQLVTLFHASTEG